METKISPIPSVSSLSKLCRHSHPRILTPVSKRARESRAQSTYSHIYQHTHPTYAFDRRPCTHICIEAYMYVFLSCRLPRVCTCTLRLQWLFPSLSNSPLGTFSSLLSPGERRRAVALVWTYMHISSTPPVHIVQYLLMRSCTRSRACCAFQLNGIHLELKNQIEAKFYPTLVTPGEMFDEITNRTHKYTRSWYCLAKLVPGTCCEC